MATLTYTNDLSTKSGQTADPSQVQTNFDDVSTLLNSTKLDPGNLNSPNADLLIGPFQVGNGSNAVPGDTSTEVFTAGYKVPAGVTLIPVEAGLFYLTDSAGSPSLDLKIQYDSSTELLNETGDKITNATAGSTATGTSFTTASVAAASQIIFQVTNSAAGGNDATYVTVYLHCKTQHRS